MTSTANTPFGSLFAVIESQSRYSVDKEKIAAAEHLKRTADGRPLVIYGCGTGGEKLFNTLAEAGVPVSAFGDTNKGGGIFWGIKSCARQN